jgi:hypothetical protein
VRRLGHEPLLHASDGVKDVDAAVIEPGEGGGGFALARALRDNGRPIVFTSIFPPNQALLDLSSAYLVKPFALHELERALVAAIPAAAASTL